MAAIEIMGVGIRGPAGTPIGVSVIDYGAVADTGANQTVKFNDAITAAPEGSIVFVPKGTYTLDKDADGFIIKIAKKNITLMGQGSNTILKLKNSIGNYVSIISDGTASGTTDMSGLRVMDLVIDGNEQNNTMADVVIASGHPLYLFPRYSIRVFSGSDCVVENVTFKNTDNVNNVVFNSASNNKRQTVRNCKFIDTGNGDVHDHSSIYFHGDGLLVDGNFFLGAGNAAGCAIETHGPNQVITNNQVIDYLSMANITGVSAVTSSSIVVTGNHGKGLMVGIQLWAYDYQSVVGRALDKCLVAHNQIEIDRDKWDGISGFKTAIFFNNGATATVRDVKIVDNQINFKAAVSSGVSNDNYSGGIVWLRTATVTEGTEDDEIEISRNTITGTMGPGIIFQPKLLTKRVRINDNMIVNPGMLATSATFRCGIYLDAVTTTATDLYDVEISRNTVVDENGTHKSPCAIDATNTSTLTNGRMVDNIFRVADGTALPVIKGDAASAFYCRQVMDVYTANTGLFTAGSQITETSTGLVYTQVTVPSGSSWAASKPQGYVGQRFVTGLYYTAPGVRGAAALTVFTKDKAAFIPFYVTETATFDRMGISVSTGQASTNGRLAIYADDGHGQPGALVLDAGTVVTTATAAVEATINQQLTPGLYWLACVTQGGTTQPTLYATNAPTIHVGAGSLANAMTGMSAYSQTSVSGAFSTYSAAGAMAFSPVIAMRVASVP